MLVCRDRYKTVPEYFYRYSNQLDDIELLQAFDGSARQLEALAKNQSYECCCGVSELQLFGHLQ